jgi:amino acid transporter
MGIIETSAEAGSAPGSNQDLHRISMHTRRKLGLPALVATMYLVVSGGAYGLEESVAIAGARLTMILCIAVPITLSLPSALMSAELTALMPVEGGFYFWVKDALGPFAGFAEAYLTLLYTAVDMAIYPVLFGAYIGFIFPIGTTGQVAAGIAMVWLAGGLNILGVRPVGTASLILFATLLAPLAALVVAGAPRLIHFSFPHEPMFGSDPAAAIGAALSVVIWNFSGWENLSVVAGEIENPRRNYLRAIAITLPIVVAGYVLPLAVAVSGARTTSGWQMGEFARVGAQIGGPLVGGALAVGGAVMAMAVFEAAMLWVSRMPFVLARERYLPQPLQAVFAPTATPARSIILCCAVFTILMPLGFVALVVLDVFFYMAALALEMAALVRLRWLRPERGAGFVIVGGRTGLALTVAMPLLTWAATFSLMLAHTGARRDLVAALALCATVWPMYRLAKSRYGGPDAGDAR